MAKSTLPRLTEKQIRQFASEQSFERGDRYYRQGAIFNATRQDRDLRADCQGSSLYHVRATLAPDDVVDARCTCPYDRGGLCKHLVALLLTYIRNPDTFQTIPPMSELLANRSQADLIQLIEQMVQQSPDLLYLVQVSTPQPAGQPIDVTVYRRKVQSALKRDEVHDILRGLEGVEDAARRLQERGDWLNAGALYQMLVDEITFAYDGELQSTDYDGDVACVNQAAIAGLTHCLEQGQKLPKKLRQDWLNSLLDAEFKDFELGGMDFAAGATDALAQFATDAEWQELESRILKQIEQCDGWRKQQLVNLLADRLRQTGKGETASQLVHELGTPEQRAFLLIEEGKFEAAIAIAVNNFSSMPGLITRFADALIDANQPDLALKFITQQQTDAPFFGYKQWLSNFHRTRGNPKLALEIDSEEFSSHPSLATYLGIRKLAQSLGKWEPLRKKLLKTLEQSKQTAVLIDIAVEEGDSDRALKLLSKAEKWIRSSRAVSVAAAIEDSYPQDAIKLYCELVEAAIANRSRPGYQTAATYLKRVKAIQPKPEWNALIKQLRTTYARLPALQDEFNQAGL